MKTNVTLFAGSGGFQQKLLPQNRHNFNSLRNESWTEFLSVYDSWFNNQQGGFCYGNHDFICAGFGHAVCPECGTENPDYDYGDEESGNINGEPENEEDEESEADDE